MPLFFAISFNSLTDRFSILILTNKFFFYVLGAFAVWAKFDNVLGNKHGLKYIIYFIKAYLCICSILLGALQLCYKIFMHFNHILVIFKYSLLGTFLYIASLI